MPSRWHAAWRAKRDCWWASPPARPPGQRCRWQAAANTRASSVLSLSPLSASDIYPLPCLPTWHKKKRWHKTLTVGRVRLGAFPRLYRDQQPTCKQTVSKKSVVSILPRTWFAQQNMQVYSPRTVLGLTRPANHEESVS